MGQVDRKSTAGRVERPGKMVRGDKYSWTGRGRCVCVWGGGGAGTLGGWKDRVMKGLRTSYVTVHLIKDDTEKHAK